MVKVYIGDCEGFIKLLTYLDKQTYIYHMNLLEFWKHNEYTRVCNLWRDSSKNEGKKNRSGKKGSFEVSLRETDGCLGVSDNQVLPNDASKSTSEEGLRVGEDFEDSWGLNDRGTERERKWFCRRLRRRYVQMDGERPETERNCVLHGWGPSVIDRGRVEKRFVSSILLSVSCFTRTWDPRFRSNSTIGVEFCIPGTIHYLSSVVIQVHLESELLLN